MYRFLFILFGLLFFSCKNQNKQKMCNLYENSYKKHYSELMQVNKKNLKFRSEYDSTIFYIDKLLRLCKPNNITLLSKKLTTLSLNEDFEKMIPVYDILIRNDSINKTLLNDYKYARFYSMVMSDSVKYKKPIYKYYEEIKKQDLNQLLTNPDVYKDQPEIYKRMRLSYYFEGRNKTIETFRRISNVIPYKFKYNIILNNNKNRIEFLQDGMK